jgi:hypothetical protein
VTKLKEALTLGVGHGDGAEEHTLNTIDTTARGLNAVAPSVPLARAGPRKTARGDG